MMMKYGLDIAVVAVMAAALSGCEKELDFRYHEIDPITVIEGGVTESGARVGITLTTPMDEPMERRRLTDARVSVEDMTDGGAVALAAGDDGMFVAPEGFGGVAGHRYRLTVERDGMSFAAESEMLAPTVITDMEFEWIKMPYDHVAVLQVTFEDDQRSSGDCYWVRVYRNGEPYRWSAVDDRTASGGYISEVIMTTRRDTEEEGDDDVLLDGDTVTVTVAPISQDMHDYLSALMSGGSNGPRMFSGDFCLGYFLAASTDSRSMTFRPDEIE